MAGRGGRGGAGGRSGRRRERHAMMRGMLQRLFGPPAAAEKRASTDEHPWEHPFLRVRNIERFHAYSRQVWQFATEHAARRPGRLRCAFAVNLAQNMYSAARIARQFGVEAELFPHPLDQTAIGAPQWDEFDGEHADVLDGKGFLARHGSLALEVPCRQVAMQGQVLLEAWQQFGTGRRAPLQRLLAACPGLRIEALLGAEGHYPYFEWARVLGEYDAAYACSNPFPAYASGIPYLAQSSGGDLRSACGQPTAAGAMLGLAFAGARFSTVTNALSIAHHRRHGFVNAVQLPYPMDTRRYAPGPSAARHEWEQRLGPGVFVLSTARLDARTKGQDAALLDALIGAARGMPSLRFVFIAWGASTADTQARLAAAGMQNRCLLLAPAGKRRLIDYYRGCDLVLDQFVAGFFGATALEAASIGRPVVMQLRTDQVAPLYGNDVPPVVHASAPDEAAAAIASLARDAGLRAARGEALRQWLLRHHGADRTGPVLAALLAVAADRVPLPPDLVTPLLDPESDAERAYHEACLAPVP